MILEGTGTIRCAITRTIASNALARVTTRPERHRTIREEKARHHIPPSVKHQALPIWSSLCWREQAQSQQVRLSSVRPESLAEERVLPSPSILPENGGDAKSPRGWHPWLRSVAPLGLGLGGDRVPGVSHPWLLTVTPLGFRWWRAAD